MRRQRPRAGERAVEGPRPFSRPALLDVGTAQCAGTSVCAQVPGERRAGFGRQRLSTGRLDVSLPEQIEDFSMGVSCSSVSGGRQPRPRDGLLLGVSALQRFLDSGFGQRSWTGVLHSLSGSHALPPICGGRRSPRAPAEDHRGGRVGVPWPHGTRARRSLQDTQELPQALVCAHTRHATPPRARALLRPAVETATAPLSAS
jgi:hypothetical protein